MSYFEFCAEFPHWLECFKIDVNDMYNWRQWQRWIMYSTQDYDYDQSDCKTVLLPFVLCKKKKKTLNQTQGLLQ